MEEFYRPTLARAYYQYLLSLLSPNCEGVDPVIYNLYSRVSRPQMPLSSFVISLFTQMSCSLEVFVLSLVYIRRLQDVYPQLFNSESAHTIVMTSVMVAHKFFDESCYKTEFYAYLSSMNISELNTVERNFLRELGFSLFVSQDEYINQYSALKAIVSSLCGEKVILPALIKVSDSHGVSSLQYQSYPQDTVCQYHYEQWKQQSLMFIPPIIPVPVTIAVASVPVYSASCIHSYNCNQV